MKYLVSILITLLVVASSAHAQEPIYLPILMRYYAMGNAYGLVVPVVDANGAPVDVTNYVLNPSGEVAGNFTNVGSATVTRSTTYQKYGLYSYRVQTTGNGDGLQVTLSSLSSSSHFVTARIRNPGTKLKFVIGSASKEPKLIEKIDSHWSLYGIGFSATQVSGQTALQINQNGLGAKDFYVDGIQVEPLSFWTTYIDGHQPGCEWNGAAHASTSTRSGQSKVGGQVKDFYRDYNFFLEKIIGGGDAALTVEVDEYAMLPGGEINTEKTHPRVFSLVGRFVAESEEQLHENTQALRLALSSDVYPGDQPTLIRFNGSRNQKEIAARYQSGLEGDLGVFYDGGYEPGESEWTQLSKYVARAAIQLVAPDPFWYEVGESAQLLDTNDSATFRIVAGRLRSTGQWDDLGPPNASGTYSYVQTIVEDGTYVYLGGSFSNFDNIANADNIVRYNKQTGAYSALGNGLGNEVFMLVLGPDGRLYAGGTFLNAGGAAAADWVAVWNGSAWAAVGTPNTGGAIMAGIHDMMFDNVGNLFIVGEFTDFAGIANADYIAVWNGSAWAAVGTGADNIVYALEKDSTYIYFGGQFTAINGTSVTRAAKWDGTSITALSGGNPSAIIYTLKFWNGLLVAGELGSPYIEYWNGSGWSILGSGTNGEVYRLEVGPDNYLYLSGNFGEAGGITLADKVARFNGYAYSHLDIDLPGSPSGAITLYPSKYADPVLNTKYSLYLGFNTSGTGNFAGSANANNDGSAIAFPDIHITRSGGTLARLQTVRNERNGLELLFDYSLLDGEELVISLYPKNRQIVSSFFGSRLDAILPNSNFGTWHLANGQSQITSFVSTSGSPTVTAWLQWRDAYKGYD